MPTFPFLSELWAHGNLTVASQTFDSICLTLKVAADNLGSEVVPVITTATYTKVDSAAAIVANIPKPKTNFCDKHQSCGTNLTLRAACHMQLSSPEHMDTDDTCLWTALLELRDTT